MGRKAAAQAAQAETLFDMGLAVFEAAQAERAAATAVASASGAVVHYMSKGAQLKGPHNVQAADRAECGAECAAAETSTVAEEVTCQSCRTVADGHAQAELDRTAELEAEEAEPTAADLERIASSRELQEVVNGYSRSDWQQVMLAADTHNSGLSVGIAAERVYISKQAARRAKREEAQRQAQRRAEFAEEAKEVFAAARETRTYRVMSRLMSALGSKRGVIMTHARHAVTVEALTWIKGEGDARSTVATFTVKHDAELTPTLYLTFEGREEVTVSEAGALQALYAALPERSADLMPRKYRHVMRTHGHKNRAVTDITGDKAVREVSKGADALSAADVEQYNGLLLVEGPKVRTTGKPSMQGVAMTASERRESDRARLKLWRERKREEARAAAAAAAVTFQEA